MAKDYSFDVVCRTDLAEAANAVNQAEKEIRTRYDFKGSKSSVTLAEGTLTFKNGIETELAKDIVKRIKGSGIKVQAKINGDELRVSGRDKDALQETIAFLKNQDLPADLQFVNYR